MRPAESRKDVAMATVNTVTGPVETSDLGFTLMHEHVVVKSPGVAENFPSVWNRAEEIERAVTLLRDVAARGVKTIVDAVVALLKPRGFVAYKPLEFKGKVEGFGLKRGESHFDVIRVNHHPKRDEAYNLGRCHLGLMAFVYPGKHHRGFEEIEFHGMKFKTPADPEGFLTARYGDWRTEIRRPEFNWFEKASPVRYDTVNYSTGYDSAQTSLVMDDGTFFRAGDLVRVEETNEVIRVTTDSASANTIIVALGW